MPAGRRNLVTSVTLLWLLATLAATADAQPRTPQADVLLYRLFLKDGSFIVSYGEYAKVGGEVVLSMPLGPDKKRLTSRSGSNVGPGSRGPSLRPSAVRDCGGLATSD